MNQELLDDKMKLFCAMYENKSIWRNPKQTMDNFKNVFVGHWDDVLFHTFDDRDASFDLCGAFTAVLDKIKSSNRKITASWIGYVGVRDVVIVIALK